MRRPRFYSAWWLAGAPLTSPEWAERDLADAPIHDAEELDMGAWLRLGDRARNEVVEAYARRRPRLSLLVV